MTVGKRHITQKMKKIPETKIGNLQVVETQSIVAHLHCYCAENAQLNVDILNEQGKTYRTHKSLLQSGPQKATIKMGQIPPGQYNAWITLGEVSAIRNFTITPKDTWKNKIQKWFKGK